MRKRSTDKIRVSWDELGISKSRYKELRAYCESKMHEPDVEVTAVQTTPMLWLWLVESVTKHKTYEMIEYTDELGRIPCGRSDFYGYRRKFYKRLNNNIISGNTYTGGI